MLVEQEIMLLLLTKDSSIQAASEVSLGVYEIDVAKHASYLI